MQILCRRAAWLAVLGLLVGTGPFAFGQDNRPIRWTSAKLPLDEIAPPVRDRVRLVVDNPVLVTQGPVETFRSNPEVYHWFLDHPDRAVGAWRKLGAKVVDISDRGQGRFGWTDGEDSDVVWETVFRNDQVRLWYARGKVKAGTLLPTVPFEAVLILRYGSGQDAGGRSIMRHQADLMIHTDSKSAAAVAKVLGATAPRLAEQYMNQVEMFFSALPWYIEEHPERAEELFAASTAPAAPSQAFEPRRRLGLLPLRRSRGSGDVTLPGAE